MEINNEMKELLDRTRRIETRLTAYLERQGEPIGNQKPVWDHTTNSILVPNMDCSIGKCISEVPIDHRGVVQVIHQRTGETVVKFLMGDHPPII